MKNEGQIAPVTSAWHEYDVHADVDEDPYGEPEELRDEITEHDPDLAIGAVCAAAAAPAAANNDEAVVAAALALRASNPMIYQLWLVSSASVARNQAAPIPALQGMGRYQITHAQFLRLQDRLPEM